MWMLKTLKIGSEENIFLYKNGYTDTGYFIELSNVEQEILIKNGAFDKNEFSTFLRKYSNGAMKPKIWKE